MLLISVTGAAAASGVLSLAAASVRRPPAEDNDSRMPGLQKVLTQVLEQARFTCIDNEIAALPRGNRHRTVWLSVDSFRR